MSSKEIAAEIVSAVGKFNIKEVTHCATRIRFDVENKKMIAKSNIEALDVVKGTLILNNQFQVFIELSEIQSIYDAILEIVQ